MYTWQAHEAFTSQLNPGQKVRLNEQWSGFNYLQREFGRMFPAAVKEVRDDVIVIGKVRFARQTLQAA